MTKICKKIKSVRKRAGKKAMELIIIMSALAIGSGIGCKQDLASKSSDTVTVTESDAETGENINPSDIHGGSPTNVTWSDCGQQIGENPCDFSFVDQFGDTFTLYDNYGTVMILDFSTMWCGVCKNLASDVQTYQDQYGPSGFLWVTLLIDDVEGGEVDEDEIKSWADTYGITASPVLAADRSLVDLTAESGYPISAWPTLVIIDRDMKIENGIVGWSESVVTGWIEAAL